MGNSKKLDQGVNPGVDPGQPNQRAIIKKTLEVSSLMWKKKS